MGTKHGQLKARESETNALERAMQAALEREERRRRSMVGAWVSATAIALVGAVVLLEGCGHGQSARSASYTPESSTATKEAVVASSGPVEPVGGGESMVSPVEVSDDLHVLPPDMVAAVSDTFVTAGEPVVVTVEGTPDITEMALSDSRGDALPMVKDTTSNCWRVGYRVPLRPKQDRIGLSITAKNEQHRWSRVWLFLQVDDGKQSVETPSASPDSH